MSKLEFCSGNYWQSFSPSSSPSSRRQLKKVRPTHACSSRVLGVILIHYALCAGVKIWPAGVSLRAGRREGLIEVGDIAQSTEREATHTRYRVRSVWSDTVNSY